MTKTAYLLLIGLFCTSVTQADLQRFSFESLHMGTKFRIILYAQRKADAEQAAQQAFQRIEQINSIMSDYQIDSELNRLITQAGTGKYIPVSNDLFSVLKQSKKWAKISGGRFDVTLGPLSKLWRKAFRQQTFPDSIAIEKAKKRTNHKWLKISLFYKKIKLKKQGMRLDLGGIAKGFAIDKAMHVLKEKKIKQALIDGGGDILVSNPPPGTDGWLIRIDEQKDFISLKNQAIASSGDRYQYLEWNGKRYSHLIDPRTGYGVENHKRISVISKNCTDADALASICSIMSKQEINTWKYLKKRKDVQIIVSRPRD